MKQLAKLETQQNRIVCVTSKANQRIILFGCNLVTLKPMTVISSSATRLILIRYDRLARRREPQHGTSLSLINVSVAAFYWQ